MTFNDVKVLLKEIGVPNSSYSIDGSGDVITPGTIIMERSPKGFYVYWTERNELYDNRFVEDESDAVEYFLHLLEGSSKTYRNYLKEQHIV